MLFYFAGTQNCICFPLLTWCVLNAPRQIRQEFLRSMKDELRQTIAQDLSARYQHRFERKLEEELRKIHRDDEHWRAKLETEERRCKGLQDALETCRSECSRIFAASQKKDAATAELALLVSEKDMLLTELALLSRAQKREISRLARRTTPCKNATDAETQRNDKMRAKTIRTKLKESLFIR